mmetsp:Transcript_24949/g.42739  ORF Transcript_24949/g.42739 Transcript_24949/m.42739 type:complete len:185 (-) Transcript_24949:172-726(-)
MEYQEDLLGSLLGGDPNNIDGETAGIGTHTVDPAVMGNGDSIQDAVNALAGLAHLPQGRINLSGINERGSAVAGTPGTTWQQQVTGGTAGVSAAAQMAATAAMGQLPQYGQGMVTPGNVTAPAATVILPTGEGGDERTIQRASCPSGICTTAEPGGDNNVAITRGNDERRTCNRASRCHNRVFL